MKEKSEDQTRSVTAEHVATHAGVSRWTVTRAFRENASISAKNREKVLSSARELGYVPDLLASSLASNRTNSVALLVDDFDNPHKLPMLQALTEALQKAGLVSVLININEGQSPADALLRASQQRVDASVLIGTGTNDELLATTLGAQKQKRLIIFARESLNPNTLSISCDGEAAVVEMAEYAIRSGYRNAMYLSGPSALSSALRRKSTFIREFNNNGLPSPEVYSVPSYNAFMSRASIRDMLAKRPRNRWPDLIFCENDVLAAGALDAIRHDLNAKSPDDIGVMGFDDIAMSAAPSYDITTYRQPINEMAVRLAEVVKSGQALTENIVLAGKFMKRSSA